MTIRTVSGFPGEGMSYDAIQLQQPTARIELRLLCLLVKGRDGQARSLPVHTLRPMSPRICPTRPHPKHGPRRWCLDAFEVGTANNPGLVLRETQAKRPTAEVLERCGKHRQAGALRAAARTFRADGVSHAMG